MSRISELLQEAARTLEVSDTARLDAELLLAHACGKNRTWLRTWPEREPDPAELELFQALLARRAAGEPVAYLLGERGFWTLSLQVTPATLIPRPDTELLVQTALELAAGAAALPVADLGTGSGAIALALAVESPDWRLTAVDASREALTVAAANAARHGIANVEFVHSDWLTALAGRQYGMVVSNPPYIAADDPHLAVGDLRFEPRTALVAGMRGLADLRRIITDAPGVLVAPGWLLLEHGFEQGEDCRGMMQARGFVDVDTRLDLDGHERVTLGRWPC